MPKLDELNIYIYDWVKKHPLEPIHIDCTTTVMLKILDGKCKMNPTSKVIMELLYDWTKQQKGKLLGDDIHSLIENSRNSLSHETKQLIYEHRLLAETMISRPTMKAYKAMIKAEGLFDSVETSAIAQIIGGENLPPQ